MRYRCENVTVRLEPQHLNRRVLIGNINQPQTGLHAGSCETCKATSGDKTRCLSWFSEAPARGSPASASKNRQLKRTAPPGKANRPMLARRFAKRGASLDNRASRNAQSARDPARNDAKSTNQVCIPLNRSPAWRRSVRHATSRRLPPRFYYIDISMRRRWKAAFLSSRAE